MGFPSSGEVLLPNCPPPVGWLDIRWRKSCLFECALPGGTSSDFNRALGSGARGSNMGLLPCTGVQHGTLTVHEGPKNLSACLLPEHLTGTPVAPPSAGPHVGRLATSPEGEHYCGTGQGAVPWCQLTGELKLTPARRRSARGRGCGFRGARTIRYRCRRPWLREGVTARETTNI